MIIKYTGKNEQRTCTILGQILSLSHYPNKLEKGRQFDFGAPDKRFNF